MKLRFLFSALFVALTACAAGSLLAQPEDERVFLLVSHPDMMDPNFARSVVLTVRADAGGPLGVILNQPTSVTLRDLYPDRDDVAKRDDVVFFGGPVQPDALLFAFRSATKPPQGLLVEDNIYISGNSAVLEELLRHPEHAEDQRFFVGYSGWADGQLEAEIEQGGWYVLPYDTAAVFAMDPRSMYEQLLRRATVPRMEAGASPRRLSMASAGSSRLQH